MSIDEMAFEKVFQIGLAAGERQPGGIFWVRKFIAAYEAAKVAEQPDDWREKEEGKRALEFLRMQGYRRCDIAACNCPYWHGGKASERLREIHEVLSDAGHEKTAIVVIKELAEMATESDIDAKRYRFLRSRSLDTIANGGVFAGMTPENIVLNEEDLDAAIDSAMRI